MKEDNVKPKKVKIIQIISHRDYKEVVGIYGLGDDSKVYQWNDYFRVWWKKI